jgi:hypothetical protein
MRIGRGCFLEARRQQLKIPLAHSSSVPLCLALRLDVRYLPGRKPGTGTVLDPSSAGPWVR